MTQAAFLNRIREVLDRQLGRWEFVVVKDLHIVAMVNGFRVRVEWSSFGGWELGVCGTCPIELTKMLSQLGSNDAGVVQ